jgi:hypothetical protein
VVSATYRVIVIITNLVISYLAAQHRHRRYLLRYLQQCPRQYHQRYPRQYLHRRRLQQEEWVVWAAPVEVEVALAVVEVALAVVEVALVVAEAAPAEVGEVQVVRLHHRHRRLHPRRHHPRRLRHLVEVEEEVAWVVVQAAAVVEVWGAAPEAV